MLIEQGVEASRTVTVHEGIDLAHVAAAPPVSVHEAYWLPHNAPLAGAIGALVGHKGHRYLIEAAAQVVREVPDARFVILGEGDLRGPLEKLIADLHLEKHVILGGFRPDVLSLLKGFDFFVMPSVTEGLGTSLLDAMACAKPIVASRVGGIPEVVVDGKTGILVPPKDPDLAGGGDRQADAGSRRGGGHGQRGLRARHRALHRGADGRRDARDLRTAGWQCPRSGQAESRRGCVKPHAFIIPRWHSEKS